MLFGEQIFDLIPQRPPIVMVDALWSVTPTEAVTGLTIKGDNIFLSDGLLREAGLIEHIAQSAAAFVGYANYASQLPPRLGYIGEIKKCKIHLLPPIGEELKTTISIVAEAAGITLIAAQTLNKAGDCVAECQMKIFLKS